MAINIGQELERLYNQTKTREASLSERLNQMDSYAQQVNPGVRAEMLDFSDRPAGYNPLQDIQSSIEFSERSRDYRTGASQDLARTQEAGLSLLSQLDALAQRAASGSQKLSPLEEMQLELEKAQALEEMKLRSALIKEQSKQGKIKIGKDGKIEVVKGGTSDTTKEILGVIDKLAKRNTKPITGALQLESMIPGTSAKQTEALYNQLKGMLSLENRQQLKGSGAISDFEFKVLGQAASALDRNMSDEDFRRTLQELKVKLQGKQPAASKPKQQPKKKDPLGIL